MYLNERGEENEEDMSGKCMFHTACLITIQRVYHTGGEKSHELSAGLG